MTNEKAIMCLEDMKIKVPIPKAAKQARENNEALDVAIKALQNVSHWIPVEQDLPQIGEYVLCKTRANHLGKYHVCKFVDKDEWVDRPHFDWGHNGFPHVIAWMPLPEPYKGVTE